MSETFVARIWVFNACCNTHSVKYNHIVACFVPRDDYTFTSDVFNSTITLILAVVCFGIDYLQCCKKGENTDKT